MTQKIDSREVNENDTAAVQFMPYFFFFICFFMVNVGIY